MAVQWTEDQQKVIKLRDRSILVSAAAGSGKTAVLVERILSKLTDPVHPVPIDRMLIMTFTRAAAGEMKERIRRSIEQELERDPENENLQKQLTLIHMAQINTIDGFCGWILRNYFHLIGLDPGYRVAEEGELELLRQDTIREVLDEFHEEGSPEYLHMLDCLCRGKSDENLRGEIDKIYKKAMSDPDPEGWLDKCIDGFDAADEAELSALPWMRDLYREAASELGEAERLFKEALDISRSVEGPYHYEEGLLDMISYTEDLKRFAEAGQFDDIVEYFSQEEFPGLSRKRPKGIDPVKKDRALSLKNEAKDILDDLRKKRFFESSSRIIETLTASRAPIEMLVRVTRRFMERFAEEKRERNILDFTDMEHFALKILSPKEGEEGGSAAARELSERFDEVMVDEYQDSNLVQEMITGYVSGWVKDRKNIFMVGDVKQSIYRFRLARPELFMEKYHKFSEDDGPEVRINLHKNFRSRPEVLSSVNYIFRRLMGEDLGGISYGDDEALYPGAVFPEGHSKDFVKTELLLVKKDDPLLEEEEEQKTEKELEAMIVADRIREIVGHEQVVDKETGEYRPARYGDIVILLRSFSGWAEVFSDVLASRGIPAYAASRSGYFSATEVVTVLNYLRVCDNPRQDIPLAGVLLSPIVGCTDEELALLRTVYKDGLLYDSVTAFLQDGSAGPEEWRERLMQKLRLFYAQLVSFRKKAVYLPVHELITDILDVTGYGLTAKAMPDGLQRAANLGMLVEKAGEYEKTGFHGLFHFIRYIENLHKYEVDYGEVNLSGAGDGAVTLMTIHKSKGLEFPIVFVSGLGKQFNLMDARDSILVDEEFGIAADAVFPERSLRVPSLKKKLTAARITAESKAEELRVLYVALTRAKEKLIMTGSVGEFPKLLEKMASSAIPENDEVLLPLRQRKNARTYLDFILYALAGHRSMAPLFYQEGILPRRNHLLYDDPAEFVIKVADVKEAVTGEAFSAVKTREALRILRQTDPEEVVDEEMREALDERFSFRYPFRELSDIPVKVTVSELKKRSYHDDEDRESVIAAEEEVVPLVPRFLAGEEEEKLTGSSRGTAYHRVMECLDYRRVSSEGEIRQQLEELISAKKLSSVQAEAIQVRDILVFLSSGVGKRMREAALRGELYREQPFMLGMNAVDIGLSMESDTMVLVQGIIDAYFYEGDSIVLLDYKTDRVSNAKALVDLYHVQLEDYAEALERLAGKTVKEKFIWSFTLGEEILV